MSWASWLCAQAKNWLLPVWMPVYGHCVASNTALQSSPPPCLPSSPATTRRPSSPITTVVVCCPPHRSGQTPTCSPQVPENFLLPAQQAYYGLRVTSNRALQSPPASDTSSSSSTPSSSPEIEHYPSVPLTTVVVRPPQQQCPGKSQTRSPLPKNVDSPPPPPYASPSSSIFSSPSSSPSTTPSSSLEREYQPTSHLTIAVVRPPHHHCTGQSPKHYPVRGNVNSPPPPPPPYATPPSSKFSSPSSSPASTPSSSLEREHQPSSQLTIGVVRPPHHHCPGQSPKHYPVRGNVNSPPPPYATPPSSKFSSPSSSPASTPSSSLEREHQPSSQLTIGVVRPPHHHCPGQSPKHYPVRGNVNSPPPPPPPYATPPSSKFSSPSSSPASTPSSSLEREHQPSSQLTIGVVRPPHHHCPGLSPKHYLVPGNVDSSSSQSISDGNSASSSSSSSSDARTPHAATATELLQEDGTNQSYEYPPPFHQILVEPGLGKVLLAADLASLLTIVVSLDKNESLGLLGRVVCLLLLPSSILLFFALLLKEIYPLVAMVTALLGIGWSIAAASAYPLNLCLPHLPVTVLSLIVALSIMTSIMIIFCFKKYERERS